MNKNAPYAQTAIVDDREDVWANAEDNSHIHSINPDGSQRHGGEPPTNLLLVRPYHFDKFVGYADVNNASGPIADSGNIPKKPLCSKDGTNPAGSKPNSTNCGVAPVSGDSDVLPNKLVERMKTDNANSDQLLQTMNVLKRLHTQFYPLNDKHLDGSSENSGSNSHTNTNGPKPKNLSGTNPEATVPFLLTNMRSQILVNCNIVLSGIISLHHPSQRNKSSPFPNRQLHPRHSVERYVEDMGAVLQTQVTASTTHVVSAREGTDKFLKGSRVKGCAVVRLSWIMECVYKWERVDVDTHLMVSIRPKDMVSDKQGLVTGSSRSAISLPQTNLETKYHEARRKQPNTKEQTQHRHQSMLLLSDDDSSEEDDDDGFADEFEREMMTND